MSVYGQNRGGIAPRRRSVFNVFAPEVLSRRTIGDGSPHLPPTSVQPILVSGVPCTFNGLASFNVSRIGSLLATPFVLLDKVFPKIPGRSGFVDFIRTRPTSVRYSVALLCVFGSQLIDPAFGANFGDKRLLWHTDIIASNTGNVKQGENGGTPERAIPCQAAYVGILPRYAEGVTTNGRAKAVMPTRAPCPEFLGDEIVCSAWEHAGASDKEPRTQTNRTTIQSRSGELADNVTNNNALLRRLRDRGNVKTFSGGNVILN